jgi:hypothetical protein
LQRKKGKCKRRQRTQSVDITEKGCSVERRRPRRTWKGRAPFGGVGLPGTGGQLAAKSKGSKKSMVGFKGF